MYDYSWICGTSNSLYVFLLVPIPANNAFNHSLKSKWHETIRTLQQKDKNVWNLLSSLELSFQEYYILCYVLPQVSSARKSVKSTSYWLRQTASTEQQINIPTIAR